MIAGSILVFGSCGSRPGAGMRRGTIGLFGPEPPRLLAHLPARRPLPAPFSLASLSRARSTRISGRPRAARRRFVALPRRSGRPWEGRGLDEIDTDETNMATEYFKIAGGTVYDPANGIDGQVRDIWITGGKIVEPPADPEIKPTRSIDARGLVVMPGGVDMHCHIVGPKVNTARKMCPEQKRRGQAVRPHRSHAQRHDGERAQHVCHRLQVRRAGLHDGLRRRHSAPGRPPCARGVRRHSLHRQRLLYR